jgi:hypothetical protein
VNLFQQLDVEWANIIGSSASRRRLREWAADGGELSRFDDLGALVLHANRRDHAAESDRILVELARRCRVDDLACRTLLQAVMPGMRSLSRRYRGVAANSMEEPISLVVSLAFERIRTYPFDRRPRRIAANVLLDTRQRLERTIGRPTPTVVSLDQLAIEPAAEAVLPDASLAVLLEAVALRLIARRDAQLVAWTRIDDRPIEDLTHHFGCSAQTLRQRRRRAESRLAPLL